MPVTSHDLAAARDPGRFRPPRFGRMSRAALASLVVVVTAAACKDKSPSKPVCSVTGVTVSPSAASLTPGSTQQLSASVSATNCTPTPTASWSSSAANVATVSTSGLVTAVGVGSATITATSSGANGSASITVTPPPIATLEISPVTSATAVGQTVTLTAIAKDAQGGVLTGRTITWASLTPSVATVNSAGVVTGVSAGTATITAAAEGRNAVAVVTVSPPPVATVTLVLNSSTLTPGERTQAVATLRDAQGAELSGRTTTWGSSNNAVATIDAFGVVSAVAPGTSTITATSEGRSGNASLTVQQTPVAAVTLALSNASMKVGDVQTAVATARDANGNVLTGRTIAWTSSNPNVATVNAGGAITAIAVGAVAITASTEGQFATAAIVVTPNVASITLTLASNPITVGQTTQATAVAKDATGATVLGVTIAYSSSNATVASVSPVGLVTAVAPGTVNIVATAGAITANASLTVNAVVIPVASVTVSPTTGAIFVGTSQQLTATPKDAAGATLTGRTVTWTTSNASVATVSSSGNVNGVGVGSATITATVEGQSATASMSVSLVPVATVTVSTPSQSVSVGSTLQASVTLRDGNNQVVNRPVQWSSSATSVATVSQSGLITANSAGSTAISAVSEGKTGSVTITVLGTPTLSISSAAPSGGSNSISIESSIAVTFSENINPATVTSGSVSLTKGGVAVSATRTVSGRVVTVTPSALLDEFSSNYVLTVTTAVKSAVGNSLASNGTLSYTTAFWDPSYYYRLTNQFGGSNLSLDTYSGGSYECFMGATGGYTGQFWYFVPVSGGYLMQNQFGTGSRALEGADTGTPCFLTGTGTLFTGMIWNAIPSTGGSYLLRPTSTSTKALATQNNVPQLFTVSGTPNQGSSFNWIFARLFRR